MRALASDIGRAGRAIVAEHLTRAHSIVERRTSGAARQQRGRCTSPFDRAR